MKSITGQLNALAEEYEANEEKFLAGNASAGTRARKTLMEIKKLCDEGRKAIQADKNS